jgi:peptidoglycan/LPS O-acetylase OafA/YrhL
LAVRTLHRSLASPAARRQIVALLKPKENGPREIRALDGLRAVAALNIVTFHVMLALQLEYTSWSHVINSYWYYLSTGVQLFFVLSGFLLFMPYARAMLDGEALPSVRRFYQRRALRILPAYLVCLVILVALKSLVDGVRFSLGDVVTHLTLINDAFPQYNRDYNGPFWTLAVEAQFYLLLPLMALIVAKVNSGRRSPRRIAVGVGLLIVGALALRLVDTLVIASMPANASLTTSPGGVFVLATMGMQGKYLEVFAVGMLCSLLYVLTVERGMLSPERLQRAARWALVACVAVIAIAIPGFKLDGVMVTPGAVWGLEVIGRPLLVGIGYGALVLALVWGGRWIRKPFEFAPVRFIGLISYSLYLWHLPIIHGDVSVFLGVPMVVKIAGALLVAYLSYQMVERPFLRRRHRLTAADKQNEPATASTRSTASTTEKEERELVATPF